jgi:hypothetical protein
MSSWQHSISFQQAISFLFLSLYVASLGVSRSTFLQRTNEASQFEQMLAFNRMSEREGAGASAPHGRMGEPIAAATRAKSADSGSISPLADAPAFNSKDNDMRSQTGLEFHLGKADARIGANFGRAQRTALSRNEHSRTCCNKKSEQPGSAIQRLFSV